MQKAEIEKTRYEELKTCPVNLDELDGTDEEKEELKKLLSKHADVLQKVMMIWDTHQQSSMKSRPQTTSQLLNLSEEFPRISMKKSRSTSRNS